MTSYDDYEQSVASGKPIELYHFASETAEHLRLNTSNETINFGSYDYEPGIIDRSAIKIGMLDNIVEVKMKRGNLFMSQFTLYPIDGRVTLTIYRQHEGYYVTYWTGVFLISVGFDSEGIPTCRFESRLNNTIRTGYRRRNQIQCEHNLFDSGCGVSEVAYSVTGTILSVSGLDITAGVFSTKADGWFVGGKIQVGYAVRLITYHLGTAIKINRPMPNADVGDSLIASAGCAHNPSTCISKFGNNIYNYGGSQYLPNKNPYYNDITV
jgi:hypothetical protein